MFWYKLPDEIVYFLFRNQQKITFNQTYYYIKIKTFWNMYKILTPIVENNIFDHKSIVSEAFFTHNWLAMRKCCIYVYINNTQGAHKKQSVWDTFFYIYILYCDTTGHRLNDLVYAITL